MIDAAYISNRLRSIPVSALWLGLVGLVPFVVLSTALVSDILLPTAVARDVLQAYAIAILAFMGGVHWGLAMARGAPLAGANQWRQYGVSTLPALMGWATVFMPGHVQFGWLAMAFALLLAYDLVVARRQGTPHWYPNLRWPLTIVVVACLTTAAVAG